MAATASTTTRETRAKSTYLPQSVFYAAELTIPPDGITKPRVLTVPSTTPEGKKRVTTKTTKANTSKPRTKVSGARVTKTKKGPVAKAKDKVTGVAEKVAGTVERKPGKKGRSLSRYMHDAI
jgi:hypothetical protein